MNAGMHNLVSRGSLSALRPEEHERHPESTIWMHGGATPCSTRLAYCGMWRSAEQVFRRTSFDSRNQSRRSMMTRTLRTLPALGAVVALIMGSVPAHAASAGAQSGRRVTSNELSHLISGIRAEREAAHQDLSAQRLPQLLDDANLDSVDAATLTDLAGLLDTVSVPAQRWVILSLGMFESRARFAVPKLLAIHSQAHCARLQGRPEGDVADVVLHAIRQITGVSPPALVCHIKLERRPESA